MHKEIFEVDFEYLVKVKTEGYKEAILHIYKDINKYAFTSHLCSKIYNHYPKAFVKESSLVKGSA